MKKLFLVLALALIFAPAAFAADTAESQDIAVAVADQQAEQVEAADVESAEIAVDTGLPKTTLETVLEQNAYECPWYTTYCRRDYQCDSYCGAVGAGACVNGCCACTF